MKRLWLLISSVLLIMCFLSNVQAHVGDTIFPIYEITDEKLMELDVRDGSIEDWEELVGDPSISAAEFDGYIRRSGGSKVGYYDPSDLDFRIWLGWNQSHCLLFFGFMAVDNSYINEYHGGAYDYNDKGSYMLPHDSLMFTVDGDHSGEKYVVDPSWTVEERTLNSNRRFQPYQAIAATPDGRHIDYPGPEKEWTITPPYGDAGGRVSGESPTVSVIEFFVTPFDDLIWNSPDESVPSVLSSGKIIGFDLAIWDHDSKPGDYQGIYSLSGEFFSWHDDASQFVDGILIGAEGDVPGGSVVESDTWARIKASFGE